MQLSNILKSLLNLQKKINLKTLPSQGYFYKDGFEIFIKKADLEDIIEYEYQYMKDNLLMNIHKVKRVVEKNTTISDGYTFMDIKSIDVVFIFFEIVKFTMNKDISLKYFDDSTGEHGEINFGPESFNYFNLDQFLSIWDEESKEFVFDGYRYSLPTIGVENSITNFLLDKNMKGDAEYGKYSYDFSYFLNHKPVLNYSEIENLLQIFNFDIDNSEIDKVRNIVNRMSGVQKYSLKKDSRVIDVSSKIDLETIWK